MANLIPFLLFVVTILDLYYNYDADEFPDYHQKRVLSDIFSLLSIFLPVFLIVFICFMGCLSNSFDKTIITCCTGLISLLIVFLEIIITLSSLLIQIYSIYIYFAYDGNSKIKKPIIKVLMWITLINLVINAILTIFKKKDNKDSNTNENGDNNNEELVEV